jgi:uncharacterized membrane protein AbrB (regulator of aidB expression)
MPEDKQNTYEDETPTLKKLRALVHQVGAGAIAYETVIPQAILTLLIVGGAVYMTVTGQTVPDWLNIATGAIIGFYFGSDFEFRRITGKAARHGRQ